MLSVEAAIPSAKAPARLLLEAAIWCQKAAMPLL